MEKNASLFTKNQQKLSLILIHQTTSNINSVDNTLLPCYTLPPTQHQSLFTLFIHFYQRDRFMGFHALIRAKNMGC